MAKPDLAFELQRLKGKKREEIIDDFGSYLIEHAEAGEELRVNPYILYWDEDLGLMDKHGTAMRQHLRWETKNDRLENQAYLQTEGVMARGEGGVWLWISPPYEEQRAEVQEARLIIGEVVRDPSASSGQAWVECIPVCLKTDGEGCVRVGEHLWSRLWGEERRMGVDELRGNIIHASGWEVGDMVNFLREEVGLKAVWEGLENGSIKKRKQEVEAKAAEIVDEYLEQLQRVEQMGERERIRLGVAMERRAVGMGMNIQSEGSCGESYMGAYGEEGIFGAIFGGAEVYGLLYFNCPVCNGPLPKGQGITVCFWCGADKDKLPRKCD